MTGPTASSAALLVAVVFTVSSVVIGPALTDSGRESRVPAEERALRSLGH